LVPDSVSVPLPILVKAPVPPIVPPSVSALAWVSTVLLPLSVMALPSDRPFAAACSVVPLAKVSPPVPRALLLPTANVPADRVVPPE
jgi:hypothetical protein